jgi:hypothetical protein
MVSYAAAQTQESFDIRGRVAEGQGCPGGDA